MAEETEICAALSTLWLGIGNHFTSKLRKLSLPVYATMKYSYIEFKKMENDIFVVDYVR